MNFILSDVADPEAEKAIRDPLVAYNLARFGESDKRELIITIRDDENIVTGGLVGHTARGWLYVQLLSYRKPCAVGARPPSCLQWPRKKPENAAAWAPISTR